MGEDLENRLAGGATLEDLANETAMDLGEIDYAGEANGDGIAAYPAFREAALQTEPGDYPELLETGDGGYFAIRVDEILPEAPRPYDEVRDQVRTGWERARITEALEAQAETLAARLTAGEDFAALALEPNTLDAVTRTTSIDSLPEGAVERLFEMSPGEIAILPGQGRVALMRLDDVVAADPEAETAVARAERLRQEAGGAIAEDLFAAYLADIQDRAGITINEQALNAVHSQLQ
jgi:peptidyl-prolyl cis-trans isomerase D